jgi:hypothetical protein
MLGCVGGIRVAEVLAALSLTSDLASGVPFEKGLRTCAVATAFGRELGLAQHDLSVVFPTGRVRDEELHLWRFGSDHKVTAFRHYVDTAKHIAAWNGEDTTRR